MQSFLYDQRKRRKLTIPANIMSQQNNANSSQTASSNEHHDIILTNDAATPNLESSVVGDDRTLRNSRIVEIRHPKRNYVKLVHTSKIADRYQLSNAAVAAVATAVLMDYEVVDAENTQKVVDPNKVRRNREIQRNSKNKNPIFALYFDGRNDQTMTYEQEKITMKKQNHISLVQQPGSFYIGHCTVESHGSYTTTQQILSYFSRYSIPVNNILAVGCDGCNENTGKFGGTIAYLESELGHPLQWFVCLLHFNELPLRHLILEHDGVTKSPKTFDGPIGKRMQNCEQQPVVKFEKIAFDCNIGDLSELSKSISSDQSYLYDICTAISNGVCESDLEKRFPGKLSHSRFVTAANRLCRLYVSTRHPSNLLVVLVKYILRVYAPTHFNIKYRPSCVFGPIHLLNVIKNSRFLEGKYLNTVQRTIARNAFFSHPESIALTMLCDNDKNVRYRAWRRLIEIRKYLSNDRVRTFNLPRLNFNANDYTEMIDFEREAQTTPPILRNFNFNMGDAKFYARKKIFEYDIGFDLKDLPCHTQSVERCVKLVTEASKCVCGEERRDGFIINTLTSRNVMPVFRTKTDFNLNNMNVEQASV